MMGGCKVIGHVDVDISLFAPKKKRSGMGSTRSEVQTMVEQHKSGVGLTDAFHHTVEAVILFRAQLTADGIHFKQSEMVFFH